MLTDRQEGRSHAASVIESAIKAPRCFVEIQETLEVLKKSAQVKPNDYRLGMLEVIGKVEEAINAKH